MFVIYTILVKEDHSLQATNRQRIMQRSKLVDQLHILIPPTYEGKDIQNATVMVEYILPVSREYTHEILVRSSELYKGYMEYKMAFDTKLTKEAGKIEVQITMILPEIDASGNITQWVRKTEPTTITISPISAWSNMISDANLTSIDQRILAQEAQIQTLVDVATALEMQKADDLSYENDELQLLANGEKIGSPVLLKCDAEDGIPVVDYGESSGGSSDNAEQGFDAVEF